MSLGKKHFYIYIKGITNFSYEFGEFVLEGRKAKKANVTKDEAKWLEDLNNTYKTLPNDKQNILVYTHGLWADNYLFTEISTGILQNEIFDQSSFPYGIILSVRWQAGLYYSTNYTLAKEKGKIFGTKIVQLLTKLKFNSDSRSLSFINHSMGNIIFITMIKEINLKVPKIRYDSALLMAADLPCNIFENELKEIVPFIKDIFVFYNSNDRTLYAANLMDSYPRLGIYGPIDRNNLPLNIHIIETTGLSDDESLIGKMTFHRYYYTSPSIRKNLLEIFVRDGKR